MSSLPPFLLLILTLLFPGVSAQAYCPSQNVQLDSLSNCDSIFSMMDRVYPELPDSFVFDEIKEVESPEDDDFPTGFIRIESTQLNESILMARRSSYLGHTLTTPVSPTMSCDRLRC